MIFALVTNLRARFGLVEVSRQGCRVGIRAAGIGGHQSESLYMV
jgi:hypothetical protein